MENALLTAPVFDRQTPTYGASLKANDNDNNYDQCCQIKFARPSKLSSSNNVDAVEPTNNGRE
jgi:hypothetical protein